MSKEDLLNSKSKREFRSIGNCLPGLPCGTCLFHCGKISSEIFHRGNLVLTSGWSSRLPFEAQRRKEVFRNKPCPSVGLSYYMNMKAWRLL
jgi:hypothetical protein